MITTRQVLDYDAATKTSFSLLLTVKDAADHTDTWFFTINLQNINDNTPEFSSSIYYATVPENTIEGKLHRINELPDFNKF